jgi:aryl-alcohol dehydrogenase-like predicted oxidoreductase
VWSPLAGGFLSGKYTRENPKGDGGRLTGFDFLPYDKDKGYQIVERVRAIGFEHNATPAQVALAWVLSKPFVSSILLGANKFAQLEDQSRGSQLTLTKEELDGLDEFSARRRSIRITLAQGWRMRF